MKCINIVLVLILIGFSACKKNKAINQPTDIDFDRNFIDHSKPNSLWQYVITQDGDTLNSSPEKIYKLPGDSIVKGNSYKVFALIEADGDTIPKFIFRFIQNAIYEPRCFNGDCTQIVEVPIVDLNRNLFESWEVQTSTIFKQILMIDSLDFMFKEHSNVFRISTEDYSFDELIGNSEYYYNASMGFLFRKTTDAITNKEFIFELEDYDIEYD